MPLHGDFLADEGRREQGREIVRADRLTGARVQRGRGRGRQVRDDVVPLPRELGLLEHVLDLTAHGFLPRSVVNSD